ncbi:hypothetical protein HHK36_028522 [Tetracentron sinense]|uniref:C2H2-type domain-containing protein n=1 Tax=Tetracentron sinense TaxID=13715 RepID=A0A835D3J2_TETSI|nr:hypothetical protein HHK36_028522 [Tetracentron sinense]
MAAELSLLSSTQLQKLAQAQQQQDPSLSTAGSWMWNNRQTKEEDDSWEVRAFAEDTGNIMGTTWPPRSYTCNFCRREFRSAQALGGHMNVHRRDRARLRQSPSGSADPSPSSASSSTLLIPTQETVATGGLCLLYPLPHPSNVYTSMAVNGCMESPSTLLSISPYPTNNLISPCPQSINFPMPSLCHSGKVESSVSIHDENYQDNKEPGVEELDLELRLGQRPAHTFISRRVTLSMTKAFALAQAEQEKEYPKDLPLVLSEMEHEEAPADMSTAQALDNAHEIHEIKGSITAIFEYLKSLTMAQASNCPILQPGPSSVEQPTRSSLNPQPTDDPNFDQYD